MAEEGRGGSNGGLEWLGWKRMARVFRLLGFIWFNGMESERNGIKARMSLE